MKKEYGRWGIFLREMEQYMNASCLDEREITQLKQIYTFANKNGFTDRLQDTEATAIIKKCKELGF
ncbi:MAG: hypothetical protein OEZ34_09000 [Spirochaetia bacterium]|nr:hypothetical protein [Spirochaetia bacterium]